MGVRTEDARTVSARRDLGRLALGRLAALIPVVWLVATVTFVVVQSAPGSYADLIDDPRLPPQAREAVRERFGLDHSLPRQYLSWLGAVARADLGVSFLYRRPVTTVIADALGPTLLLAGTALALDLLLGLAVAVASLRRPHGRLDRALSISALTVWAVPTFWLAGIGVLVFSVQLGWLPASHMYSVGAERLGWAARLVDLLHHLVLPAACLGVVGAASTSRYLRASLLELRRSTFLLAARARGLPERRVMWVHALRPALLPVATMLGLSIPVLVSGALVIEVIFSWPGMGRVMWDAAFARDVPVVQAVTILGAAAVVMGNLVADLLVAVLDPRVRSRS